MNERERQIYDYVRDHQPVSAAAVAEAIPSIPSVATYISRLKKEGYLSVQGNETITQSNGQVIPRSLYGTGEVVPPQEQEPSAAPTTTPPTPQNDTDPIASLLHTHTQNFTNAPQTATDAPQSTQAPTDAQFTDEDEKTLYDEILERRKYYQNPFDVIDDMISDVQGGEITLKQFFEVNMYVRDAMIGKRTCSPSATEIPDAVVRMYVRRWLKSKDAYNADEYVGFILVKQRHGKAAKSINGKKQTIDISGTQWAQNLANAFKSKC